MFHGGRLQLTSDGPRRQFKLIYPEAEIGYMAWTAGQREFIPLLLGVYHLVPLGNKRRVEPVDWVVIEEPEMGLHTLAIQAVLLLILELMERGYRVVLSTHSLSVTETVWGLRSLQASNAKAADVLKMFGIEGKRWDLDELAKGTLRKSFRVYHLDYERGRVRSKDISNLDPDARNERERTWGGLTKQSERVNKAVTSAGRAS
jgi:hypothetical protein